MIARRDQLHEVLAHHVGVFALERAFHIGIDDALCGDLFLHIMVDQFGVVLRAHTGQRLALGLGYAQSVERVLYVLRHVLPVVFHIGLGANIGRDVIHVQPFDGRAPVGHAHLVIYLQRLQAELLHPDGVVLLLGQLIDYLWGKTGLHAVCVVLLVAYVVHAAVYIVNNALFFHHLRSPPYSAFMLAKPFSLISSTSSAPPSLTITPFSITCVRSTFSASSMRVL